ncbi:MAG TPA: ABC transporter substrate-binding protein [Acidimicrobiales bacterium]|nr:ABC transporter substrate-binding protein [Acidimicrobiales bacterium]
MLLVPGKTKAKGALTIMRLRMMPAFLTSRSARRKRLPVLVAALAAVGMGTSPAVAGAGELRAATGATSVSLELDWVPNPDHVSLYYAKEKGFFSKAGLNADFLVPSDVTDPIKLVGLNKVDLAISYESELFYAQQEKLPVEAVSTVVPVPLNSLIVLPRFHVTRLSQMKGKTLGITGIPSDGAIYQMLLKTAHLTAKEVPTVTVGADLVPAVLSGKVDAILGGYRNVEAIQIAQELGKKPTVFPASELGVPNYAELVLVANRNRLGSDPAYASEVKSFVGALTYATAAAIADPAGTTSIMERVTQYTTEFLKVSVPYTLSLIKPAAGQKIGCMSEAGWQSFGNWMKSESLISIVPNASVLTTDQYLPYSC